MNRALHSGMFLMLALCLALALYLLFAPGALAAEGLQGQLTLGGVPCQVDAPFPGDYPPTAAEYRCPGLDKQALKAARDSLPYAALGIPAPQGLRWEYDTGGVYMMDKAFNPGSAYPWRIDLMTGSLSFQNETFAEILKTVHRDDSFQSWQQTDAKVAKTAYAPENAPDGECLAFADAQAAMKRAAAALGVSLGDIQTAELCTAQDMGPLYYLRYTALVGGLPLPQNRSQGGWQGNSSDVPLPCTLVYGSQGVMEICLPLTSVFSRVGEAQRVLSPQEALAALEANWDAPAYDTKAIIIRKITLRALPFSKSGNWSYGYSILPVWHFEGTRTVGQQEYPFDAYLHAAKGLLVR